MSSTWSKTLSAGLVLAAAWLPMGHRAPAGRSAHDGFYLGGVQVREPDSAHWAGALRRVGMNTVHVTAYATQGAWDGDELRFDPPDRGIVEEIRAAKREGLAVVLILRVALDHGNPANRHLWHGMIMPHSESAIRSWFDRYAEFALPWAAVAQREGVDVLGIGSELNALNSTLPITWLGNLENYYAHYWYQWVFRNRGRSFAQRLEPDDLRVMGYGDHRSVEEFLDDRFRRTVDWGRQVYLRSERDVLRQINRRRRLIDAQWVALIDALRSRYDGRLTYAANFDSYRNVGFWPALDMIGINAYFPLRTDLDRELQPEEKLELFAERWERIFAGIRRFKREQGLGHKPLLFTELGYTFRRHATLEPWNQGGFSVVGWGASRRRLIVWDEQPVDYEERRLALRALARVHRRDPHELSGILYWKLSTDKRHEAIEPFVMHVGPDSTDPLQQELLRFVGIGA